jgi:hypothetical protein
MYACGRFDTRRWDRDLWTRQLRIKVDHILASKKESSFDLDPFAGPEQKEKKARREEDVPNPTEQYCSLEETQCNWKVVSLAEQRTTFTPHTRLSSC